jgi:hypothetical protein
MHVASFFLAVWSDLAKAAAMGGALIVVFVAAGLLVMWTRKRYLARPRQGAESGKGFGIEDLEAMLTSGRITKEEFRLLRRSALGLEASGASGDNSTSSPPPADDDVKEEAREGPPCP